MSSLLKQRLLTPGELAAAVNVTTETLAEWRQLGTGPTFVQLTLRSVVYPEADVELWLQARRQKGGNEIHGNPQKRRVLAFPVHDPRPRVLGQHRFGRRRTKSEIRAEA